MLYRMVCIKVLHELISVQYRAGRPWKGVDFYEKTIAARALSNYQLYMNYLYMA